jgi:hypothetical protein
LLAFFSVAAFYPLPVLLKCGRIELIGAFWVFEIDHDFSLFECSPEGLRVD